MSDARPPELDPGSLHKLGLLVAGIAHNLYGPLTGILGTIDLLKLKHPDLADDLSRVGQLGRRLQDEIQVMLHKAEIESKGMIRELDMAWLVGNEVEFYKGDPRFKHMAEVTVELPEEVPRFHAPAGAFSQAISNILTNAVEALEDSKEKRIDIKLVVEGETMRLSVTDSGVGMDEATLARATEPFFTTKEPSKVENKFPATLATGIGLSHAVAMLEPLGVEITLESTPGEGTTVRLMIPYTAIHERYSQG